MTVKNALHKAFKAACKGAGKRYLKSMSRMANMIGALCPQSEALLIGNMPTLESGLHDLTLEYI